MANKKPVRVQTKDGWNYKKARKISDWLYIVAAVAILAAVLGFRGVEEYRTLYIITLVVGIAFLLAGMVVYLNGCVCPHCGSVLPRQHGPFCEDCDKRLESFFDGEPDRPEKAPVWQPEKPQVSAEHATPKPVHKNSQTKKKK